MSDTNEEMRSQVRAGEEVEGERLQAWISGLGLGVSGVAEITQFVGGASNLTYLLHYRERDLILRRPPPGHKAKSAHDVLREAQLMQSLRPHYPYVPRVLGVYEASDDLGPAYLMERLDGLILRKDLPAGLSLDAAAARTLCEAVVDRLVELHAIDVVAAGLSHLGRGQGYVERQIHGWSERFRQVHTSDVASFTAVMHWLHEHQPADSGLCLIHNDYRFDNVVLDRAQPSRVIGVLDWEMATLGDPLMDLGNTLAYWVQADDEPAWQALRRQPTQVAGMLTRQELIEFYGERSGRTTGDMLFYSVYGLFRLAVIAQQIYYRHVHGQVAHQAYAGFGRIVDLLERRAQRMIERGLI